MRIELYNLKSDLSETTDLAASNEEKAQELRGQLHTWRQSMRAQMPTANPNHRPGK